MITVIIPALNEEKTIRHVIKLAKRSKLVSEIIVVDDQSIDDTVNEARKESATVITSTKLGKGASMKDGVLFAHNEIIVFLDADITTYPENIIELLTTPILENRADFIKSYFERQAGRVTELVAKPLLSLLNPSFPNFKQPLSGMIAGRKQLFSKCEFEEGYGVDIGILIDMHEMGARIEEVGIGKIENRMHPLELLGRMSREVARTIIKKTKSIFSNISAPVVNHHEIRGKEELRILERLRHLKKIAVFDMDNTILRTSFIRAAAERFRFKTRLADIQARTDNPFVRTKMIAALLKGRSIAELLELTDSILVTPYLEELVAELKKQGYITVIISDSYDCITNHLKNKFGFDLTISNELEFSKSMATGEVKIPSLFLPLEDGVCQHEYCKLNAMIRLCRHYGITMNNTLVIGDGENDICCIRKAGIGISFCSTHELVDAVADHIIKEPDFQYLNPILNLNRVRVNNDSYLLPHLPA